MENVWFTFFSLVVVLNGVVEQVVDHVGVSGRVELNEEHARERDGHHESGQEEKRQTYAQVVQIVVFPLVQRE